MFPLPSPLRSVSHLNEQVMRDDDWTKVSQHFRSFREPSARFVTTVAPTSQVFGRFARRNDVLQILRHGFPVYVTRCST